MEVKFFQAHIWLNMYIFFLQTGAAAKSWSFWSNLHH